MSKGQTNIYATAWILTTRRKSIIKELPKLVVVPRDQLDEGLGQLNAGLGIEDGGPEKYSC